MLYRFAPRSVALPRSLENDLEKVFSCSTFKSTAQFIKQGMGVLLGIPSPLIAKQILQVGNITRLPPYTLTKIRVTSNGNL